MKFYDFVDRAPVIPKLTVIEGEEPVFSEAALAILLDRLLPDMRDLNLETFAGTELDDAGKVEAGVGAMPFLAERRVVVVRGCQAMRAALRRSLWAVAEAVPAGNALILEDLLAPARKTKPEPFGALAGRSALRIDTTAAPPARHRYVTELLERLGATAEPRVVAALAASDAPLAAVRNDLEKLALSGRKITYADLEAETLSVEDPKAYRYAGALVEGRPAEALAIAFEMFANDVRGAGIPLASALATECGLLWELARPGGELPPRFKWRERVLRPIAVRVGERRARYGFERAVRGFEAVVTGRIEDPRAMIEILTADVAARLERPR